ncbi:3-oxoacyl-ACP reductase family protein [Janthinobacterium agaricidamnosum]|uniref:Short chain dehydrogenase family protein n=1 Tax=Janthinobacterium agaricidamnosum NBRC 102515 = DSM 9628 TaxID=1349767 RepID=W0V6Z3_9BURK|nr:3-oxoacyl-ACP reductase family protein [Janthinobacterium agaricidamnosum]CDG83651.1 short chain dehydrogenase family protein [Janthinobacterium agaricidamnosum NBRC 102515 = DSM 9628]
MNNITTSRVALVTGGSRGIGAAIVQRLASDGIAVAFTSVSPAGTAEDLAATIRAAGGKALAIKADSSDAEAVKAAVELTVATFGRLDILVGNAGIAERGTVDSMPLELFDRMFAVNVRAQFVAAQAASVHLPQGGRIVIIGSVVANRTGFPGVSAYSMTKGAVAAMVRGMAIDLAPRGITVNNVQPGPTDTDMNPGDGEYAPMVRSLIPLGRFGKAQEVASMVAYLAGEEAGFVTGASLTVDGGYLA